MARPRGAYIGGHSLVYLPDATVPLEAACHDMEFIELCGDLACYMVPPKDVLASMFTERRFTAPPSGWTSDAAAKAFKQALGLVLRREAGPRASRKQALNLWKESPPRILGVSADGTPYAWSPENWL